MMLVPSPNLFDIDPEIFLWILTKQDLFCMEPKAVCPIILHDVARAFGLKITEFANMSIIPWAELLSHLLQIGFSLSGLNDRGKSPLDGLFLVHCLDSGESGSRFIGGRWLALLSSIRVDVEAYVIIEESLHPKGTVLKFADVQRRYVFKTEANELPEVWWEWLIPPESPAYLAIQEFKIMCLEVAVWKVVSTDWENTWPYDLRSFQYGIKYGSLEKVEENMDKRTNRWTRKAEQKEQRRTHYKTPRLYQPRRSRQAQMPGSWIEYRHNDINQSRKFSLRIPRWLIMPIVGLAGHLLIHVFLTHFAGTNHPTPTKTKDH